MVERFPTSLRAARGLPVLVLLAVSCGAEKEPAPDSHESGGTAGVSSAGSGGAPSAGSGGTSSTGTGGAGSAGAASAGASSGGSGGAGGGTAGKGVSCDGVFGAPVLEFSGSLEAIPQSLSVTGDGLELYYAELRLESAHLFVRKRSSRNERFGPATELPAALTAFCPTPYTLPSVDVSDDGLRLYLTCVDDSLDGSTIDPGPLRMAERASRDADFVLSPDPLGVAYTSINVSPDELSLFSSDLSDVSAPRTTLHRRASRDVPFSGEPPEVPSIGRDFWHPEFVGDSLHVFGAVQGATPGVLVSITRSTEDGAFSNPSREGLPLAPIETGYLVHLLTPTLTSDCRSIYFLQMKHTEDYEDYAFDVYSASR